MKNYVIAIDQSTSATKALLFDERCNLISRFDVPHKQYYPKSGWVEHDAEEIYSNTLKAISSLLENTRIEQDSHFSLAITNQRETVVVWDKFTGHTVYNAVVWQCRRGAAICQELKDKGYSDIVKEKSGLLLDPYFAASGAKWILDNVKGARDTAEKGNLLMGTIDSWLIWKLTEGKVHATDYTNASRTLLFNIHTLSWDDDLLRLFTIPKNMMPQVHPCDYVFGETTADGYFKEPIKIAGVLGDSHGALVGQMCFNSGMGKVTYGTGSSVMINIGNDVKEAPEGLVTSVGFSALGQTFYAYEGNIHCTGATIKWLADKLELIKSPKDIEYIATSVSDTGGVYFVPAFAGLGAPWWDDNAKAMIYGMTLGTTKAHVLRAALESIAYQVKDLVDLMAKHATVTLKELRVDGGPTHNKFLMQFQSDMLDVAINVSNIEETSALGATIMNGFARGIWHSFDEVSSIRKENNNIIPKMADQQREALYHGWLDAIRRVCK